MKIAALFEVIIVHDKTNQDGTKFMTFGRFLREPLDFRRAKSFFIATFLYTISEVSHYLYGFLVVKVEPYYLVVIPRIARGDVYYATELWENNCNDPCELG